MEPNAPGTPNQQPTNPTDTPPAAPPAQPVVPSGPAPVTGQPVVNGVHGAVPEAGAFVQKRSGKPRWFLPAVAAAVVLLLAGGFTFGYYLPNQPNAVFSKALSNSGKAVDKLVSYGTDSKNDDFVAADFDGTLKVASPDASVDVTISGEVDKDANGSLKIDANAAGEKFNAEIRSIHVAGNSNPDVYVKIAGIKPLLDSVGYEMFDSLDGQWVSIDHTLLDSYTSSLETVNTSEEPTTAQINDAVVKVQQVNKDYLFTTDSDKAVLTNKKFVGKETVDGLKTNHYKVGYDKAHLKAYTEALKKAIDSSKLNDWSKKVNDGKSLSEVADFDSIIKSAEEGSGNGQVDLYVDLDTKLIHSIVFPMSDSTSKGTFTIAQNYKGGDEYPFSIAVANSSSSEKTTAKFDLNWNSKTNKTTVGIDAKVVSDSGSTTVKGNFNVTENKNKVTVTAPTGSKTITEIMNELGLGDAFSSTSDELTASESDLFTLTQ